MAKKPTVTTLQSGFNSTEVLNQNFEALRDAFDNTLSLDGSTPNAMEADLDLNGNNIIGASGLLINGTDYLADVEAAKAAALVAQSAAELAENNAETAEVNAEASETAAGLSATAAASSAAASAASAVDATNNGAAQVVLAAAQVTLAEIAKTGAELAETNAETAETNAETAETNAQASALAALASEIAASTSETNAAASEAASSTSETNAAASAAAASTSETNAATSETNAANSATASASSATASAASATASAASATAASASETAAASSETAAAASEAAASTSETNAAASETAAAASETAAASSASSASTSASNAASSASSASASADAALAALDNFDDRYLGQKASDPTLDNDGDALVAGALYFNTTDEIMKVFDGSLWVAAYASLSGAMFGANNLSDVASASDSRANLGLGTAATTASTDYATAAQGSLADSAVQPNDSPTFAGLTTTGNVSFGDNDKAIFGAGSDLQIYHAGSASYIDDVGTGSLNVRGTNLFLRDASDNLMAGGIAGAEFRLYHNANLKLVTTSTGIDVTGTVTADGLTVDGVIQTVGGGSAGAVAIGVGDTDSGLYRSAFNEVRISAGGKGVAGFFNSGDISFYEDTGTTPKFFWDASAESLGIGTSSLAGNNRLHVHNGVNTTGLLLETSSTVSRMAFKDTNTTDANAVRIGSETDDMAFFAGSSERMRIDSSGNLLVGTTVVPNTLAGASATQGVAVNGGTGYLVAAASGTATAYFNRQASDGDIAEFRKDGSTVGSIGAVNGDMYIATGDTGLRFVDVNDSITPTGANGAARDNAVDLGNTGTRFKDLYLSGTANAANFNTTSDATLKTNVETLTGSLDAVNALRGVSFDWIENGGSEVGFIAQEVEEVLPEVVSTNDQGIKSVKYGNMVAVLVEAIKEQQLRIEALEAKLEG